MGGAGAGREGVVPEKDKEVRDCRTSRLEKGK